MKHNNINHPLFLGLTRPPMFMGITLDVLSILAISCLCIFILANNFFYLLMYVPLHLVAWMLCRMDPNIFRVLLKSAECVYAPNQRYWGCHSYEAF